jgi:UDP-glucose 4-epimerase
MRAFVTGCAGFIASHLTDQLLREGNEVVGYDNFSTGQKQFLSEAMTSPRFSLHEGDLLDQKRLEAAIQGCDTVFHFAANADVRYGPEHPRKDLDQNVIATVNVLQAMQKNAIKRIAFSSTGSIYGEPAIFPTPEEIPMPVQTSLYGASKLAAEGFLQAFSESFGMQVFIFRFVSNLGPRYQHGHIVDFYRQLQQHPETLQVLGDGRQRKSYLHVHDCVDGVLRCLDHATGKTNIFNLGTPAYCELNDSIDWICNELGLKPKRIYSGGARGWTGDNPFIFLDCSKASRLGWQPKFGIQEAVVDTLKYLQSEDGQQMLKHLAH